MFRTADGMIHSWYPVMYKCCNKQERKCKAWLNNFFQSPSQTILVVPRLNKHNTRCTLTT